jgi:alpha-galactosidase
MRSTFITLMLATMCIALPAQAQDSPENKKDMSQYILTPKAPVTPRINGAKIYGCRPGADFIYRIPATGDRPMTFSAVNLPKGLSLDAKTGIIKGSVKKEGTYEVTIKAVNSKGSVERPFKIVVGDKLALTPPMGWNSWNCWGNTVSQERVLSSARALIDKGLVNYGWSYINIDDGWQGVRGGEFNGIQPNKKFPDMKAFVDEIHAQGLKVGIYSGPWVGTYAGQIGTQCDNADGTYDWIKEGKVNDNFRVEETALRRSNYRHGKYSFAVADAKQWAAWGFDYLKYDWYPNDVNNTKEMYDALKATGRDIILSLSNSCPFADISRIIKYANCVRTTGDIRDEWGNMSNIGFYRQGAWAPYVGPGHWMDADMLVVGKVGWGDNTHDSKLTADEQYAHITLWAMLSSPLLIGCDIAAMDDFTLSLLTNSEVIDVNQDPLGIPATRFFWDDKYATYVKPLEDGSVAVAMFNFDEAPQKIGFVARSFGLTETVTVRDLWRQQDIQQLAAGERYDVEVAPHGAALYKLYPGNPEGRRVGDWRGSSSSYPKSIQSK